ncbi:MAG: ABC transporter ATP-binding protein [Desulfobacterota bacterium]|jgi:molybdate/tungstate transport system ATP-binding protein|nr:ABC transporter ATP-binding protein [Thermodesulfobacteriota bacterium]
MIRIENLNIRLLDFHLKNIHLEVEESEFFMIMGPTGAGKTVLLEAIAGLVPVDTGRVWIDGRDVTGLPSEKREVGLVYQDHALFPHLNVLENITYGLRFHGVSREEGEKRRIRLTRLLNLDHLLSRLPLNLSGGEKQRVALARALIVRPRILLLDEPLSALDPNFREDIRNALKRLHENTQTTFLMVTHDFGEALALADRGAVIDQGAIKQVGAIHDLFQKPCSCSVADFVGMKNLFEARFQDGVAEVRGIKIRLNQAPGANHRYVAIRPEDIGLSVIPGASNPGNLFAALVTAVSSQGFTYEVQATAANVVFRALVTKKSLVDKEIREGLEVFISFDPSCVHTF